jgi:hypothetical protein
MMVRSMTMTAVTLAMSLAVTSATSLLACGNAMAGETWLCSVASAVAVDEDGTVGPPELGDRERPTFFRVDAAKKELTLLAPDSRRGEVTKFDTATNADGLRVFSAVENDRGVSLIITPQGRMTLSIISDGVVWSVFGHALAEDGSK